MNEKGKPEKKKDPCPYCGCQHVHISPCGQRAVYEADVGFNQGLDLTEAYWKPKVEKLEDNILVLYEQLKFDRKIVKEFRQQLQSSKAKVEGLEKDLKDKNDFIYNLILTENDLEQKLRSLKAKELSKGKLKIILDDILVRVLRRHCELTNVSIPCCKELIDKQAQAILDAGETKHKHIWIRQVSDGCHYEKCALCPKIRYK